MASAVFQAIVFTGTRAGRKVILRTALQFAKHHFWTALHAEPVAGSHADDRTLEHNAITDIAW